MQMQQQPRVVASASATVGVEADAATLTVAVETRAPSAAEAAEDNAERLQRVLDELDDAGYDDEVSTSGYSLWPYAGRESETEGYVAVNTVTVRIDEIDEVGEVIDRAIEAGANRIPSVSFVADDIEDARHRALEQAISQARADAEVMARAAGRGLGDLIELTTQGVDAVPMREMMSLQAGTPVVGPTQQVTVHVTTTWGLR
jgi:hypothetical protein